MTIEEKSYVGLQIEVCAVCGQEYDAGVLLDKRLRNSLPKKTITGWGMCEEHKKLKEGGYVFLVGIDPDKSDIAQPAQAQESARPSKGAPEPEGVSTLNGAYRTGATASVRPEALEALLGIVPPEQGIMFVKDAVFDILQERMDEQLALQEQSE